ncbi:ATP-binding protein [Flavobacterium johnsoniae]|uniref:ATP-binding protein n=2 Tax=Flavobacterium johnsoniae TaxID=986 RepID=UPI003D970B7A
MYQYLILNYRSALAGEQGILNRARMKLLAVILILFIFQRIISLFLLLGQAEGFYIWRSALLLLFLTALLIFLFCGFSWRLLGHAYIWIVSILIWSAIVTLRQGVNLVTLQYILIIISVAYYILGTRWGLIYSLANIVPVTAMVFLAPYTGIDLMQADLNLNMRAFNFLFVYNFFSLLFVHYFFFDAFKKTNQRERQLSLSLKQSLKDAQDLASAKTNFLSTMSHELRTPLNAVAGMAELLAMSDLKPADRENLEVLRFSAQNLMFIINDILDFNKIDADKVVLKNDGFRLDLLLKNIYRSFAAETQAKNIGFDLQCDPGLENVKLLGDKDRLSQILFNIVGNAVKFTIQGSVAVQAAISERDREKLTVLFIVRDTGIGISPEEQHQILDPFVQKNSKSNRQFYGTGLGLTIASRLISLKGGVLKISSSEGHGAELSFELAFKMITSADSGGDFKSLPSEKDISSLRVLAAEDNAVNIMVIKKLLNKWNIQPVIARNGREALDAVISNDYDLVLMDINMPLMDGFEAAQMIRNLPDKAKASIPIIALTASVDFSSSQQSGCEYINDYILKPFSAALLKEKLDQLMGAH